MKSRWPTRNNVGVLIRSAWRNGYETELSLPWKDIQPWLTRNRGRLRLFFLPGYSPELNPDELLNQDVKSNAVGRRPPVDAENLMSNVRGYVRSTQRMPHLVRSFFDGEHVRYAR